METVLGMTTNQICCIFKRNESILLVFLKVSEIIFGDCQKNFNIDGTPVCDVTSYDPPEISSCW